jgi:biotin-(acetyl-CoA carboxylase) ligase
MKTLLDRTESTQLDLKKAYQEALGELPSGSSVQALEQAAGRGRQGRVWTSPLGGLYLSVLLKGLFAQPTWIPHFVAVSVCEALLSFGISGERLKIKWPNDLMIDGSKKLCGILCEKNGDAVFAGIGLNVAKTPEGLDREVISLKELGFRDLEILKSPFPALRDAIILNLSQPFDLETVKKTYATHSLFQPGEMIYWEDVSHPRVRHGIFLSYGEFGEMKISEILTDGTTSEQELFSEEVHLRLDKSS